MPTRRQLIAGAAVATGAVVLPLTAADPALAEPLRGEHHDHDGPFALGIASGDPLPDGVILWTRLLRASGPLPARPVDVEWQVALDERFRRVVRSGHTKALPQLGEVGKDLWRTDARTVDTIATRTAAVSTSASYVVEAGTSALSTG